MSTIVLGNVGAAIGGLFGPVGALLGRAAGALAGAALDSALVSALSPPTRIEGPRLTTSDIQTSTEGSGVTRLYGRARTSGQIIWATRFEEVISTERSGGKGGQPKVEATSYSYFGNLAIGLCEGPIAGIGRIFADGDELDQALVEVRLYRGTADQMPDPLIEAKEAIAPAYRHLAYMVFERLPLADYGNRIPQISVEVFRPVGRMEELIEGAAGSSENRHTLTAATDFIASIDRLTDLCPNLKSVMLVVSWFGDDLRCGYCRIRPKVEIAGKETGPLAWSAAGLSRGQGAVVLKIGGKPAYGGTPSDATVIQAIRHLTGRGIAVTYCPFVMMDIPAGNGLPDPYLGSEQARLPWRGRITCDPAPGKPDTVDRTASAGAQVASFLGTASAADFSVDAESGSVSYSGPDEWHFRRFILQNAALAAAAGVDTFLIGSEMAGLTPVRSATGYPFVAGLVDLAGECRALLGPDVAIGYAADWSEWSNHRPDDGSGDVIFHLDPLWTDSDIDFVGIDAYFALADWRDGTAHLDFAAAGPVSTYDQAYLTANIEGGENFDWHYADLGSRIAQNRTEITDWHPAGESWIFRNKDIRSWWGSAHHDRPAGSRSPAPTGWAPGMKPVRLIEFGCPAVDKGANQPNVFPDERSAEGAYPWFSNAARDDGMQRAYIGALLSYWADPANNPVSPTYGGRMIDLSRSHAWCWDSRPWPSYPIDESWGDAENWQTGHWLSGRFGAAPAAETIDLILAEAGLTQRSVGALPYVVDGVTGNGIQSARSLLEALRPVFGFDAIESDGLIKIRDRHAVTPVATISADDLVAGENATPAWRRTRAQETELPAAVKLSHGDPVRQDQVASAEARRSTSVSLRTVSLSPPAVLSAARAREAAELELAAAWTGREQVELTLPPSRIGLDPGDVFHFEPTGKLARLTSIDDRLAREANAVEVDPALSPSVLSTRLKAPTVARPPVIAPRILLVDGPLLADTDLDHAGYVAGLMSPFRSGVTAWRSPEETGYARDASLDLPAIAGVLAEPLYSGPVWRFDRVNRLYVRLQRGSLSSVTEAALFAGANPLLVENAEGEWELLQFATADLIAPLTYALSNLLRGQKGSEHAMRDPVAAGARILFVDAALRQTALTTAHLGLPLNWRAGPADRDISAAGPVSIVTMRGKGRRPLSPVHLKVRASGGDLVLTWIRRSRISGDSWDQPDVPLGEESEAYAVEILSGATVVRTFATTAATVTYTAADRAADGVAAPFDFTVTQMSQTFGRGITARSTYHG